MFLAVLLLLQLLFPPLTHFGFFNGMPEIFQAEALNFSTFSRFILWCLLVFRNPTTTCLPLFETLDPVLYDLIALAPSVAFFFLMTCTPAMESSFSSSTVYLSLIFPPPLSLSLSLSPLHPYSDYTGVNILLNNSSSLS